MASSSSPILLRQAAPDEKDGRHEVHAHDLCQQEHQDTRRPARAAASYLRKYLREYEILW